MKNLYFLLLTALLALGANAQTEQYYFPDAFYMVKEVNVEKFRERQFHFEISVKENPSDTFSRPRIYAVQVRKGKEDVIGKSMTYATVSNVFGWKTYSIDGIVESDATRVWLYLAVNGNGEFLFDNILYSVADNNGTLVEKDLPNASFEEKQFLSGYFLSSRKSTDNVKVNLSNVSLEGRQAVQVLSSGQKPGIRFGVASK